MSNNCDAKYYKMIRPGDDFQVTVTCTSDQLTAWIDEGYLLLVEDDNVEQKTKNNSGSKDSKNTPANLRD